MLNEISSSRKTGSELFISRELSNLKLLDFWQWSASDLLSNATRGILGEFIVASALGIAKGIRREWDAFDLITENGMTIEVKTSAYVQSWYQKNYSRITFSISPSLAWDFETNAFNTDSVRQADLYVFCLLHHKDQDTIDPMDLNQWTFYVLPTKLLNEKLGNQKTLGLATLLGLGPSICRYEALKNVINCLK